MGDIWIVLLQQSPRTDPGGPRSACWGIAVIALTGCATEPLHPKMKSKS